MSSRETYDVSPIERKVLEARAARRLKLRNEYLQQIGNPYRAATGEGGSVFDVGLERYMSMRATAGHFFKETPKTIQFYIGSFLIPTIGVMYIMISGKNAMEHEMRTGQISYRDREFKFQ